MPNQLASATTDTLKLIARVDAARAAGDPFTLPAFLRADVDADLLTLADTDEATGSAEGDRAAASARRRRALDELARQLRGGYRFLAAIDEADITEDGRRRAFEAYGWKSGNVGVALEADDGILANARVALGLGDADVPDARHRYPAARLQRIQTQLDIAEADQATATGGSRQSITRRRNQALEIAETTAARVRFFYCCASRDADQTPELARIGFQPRRDPGEVAHPAADGSTPGSAGVPAGGLVPGALAST